MRDYLAEFLADFADAPVAETIRGRSARSDKRASVTSGTANPKQSGHTMDGLAVIEVLGFQARLMAGLPLVTALVVEPVAGGPHRSLDPSAFTMLGSSAGLPPDATVAAVLAHHRLRLRAVVIDGGAL